MRQFHIATDGKIVSPKHYAYGTTFHHFARMINRDPEEDLKPEPTEKRPLDSEDGLYNLCQAAPFQVSNHKTGFKFHFTLTDSGCCISEENLKKFYAPGPTYDVDATAKYHGMEEIDAVDGVRHFIRFARSKGKGGWINRFTNSIINVTTPIEHGKL